MFVGGGLAVESIAVVTVLGAAGAGTSVHRTDIGTHVVWVASVQEPPRCGCPARITTGKMPA